MALRFEADAAEEFYRAVAYYESQSLGLGAALVSDLDRIGALVAANPEMGGPGPSGTRRLLLSRFPFLVVYRLFDREPVVVAFAHQSQEPGYWLDRI